MTTATRLVDVRLLEFPVSLWARAQEQSEALQREFALVASDTSGVPARLLEVVRQVRAQYARDTSEQEELLLDAADAGVTVLPELVYRVPPQVAEAAQALGAVFAEADEHCRRGDHLLTLAPDEELLAFRHWFLGEFVDQLAGAPPVPWPAYRGGR